MDKDDDNTTTNGTESKLLSQHIHCRKSMKKSIETIGKILVTDLAEEAGRRGRSR